MIPQQGFQLNPAASHPPFSWWVDLPSDWSVIDSHPSSWKLSAERLIDAQFAGRRLNAAHRRAVHAEIEKLVAAAQQGNVLLSLLHIQRLSSGGVASAGINLAWYDSSPDPASIELVQAALTGRGSVSAHGTTTDPLLLHTEFDTGRSPFLAEPVELISLQAYRPLPRSCWTAVVATSVQAELRATLESIVLGVAASVREGPHSEQDAVGPARGQEAATRWQLAQVDAPGVERGFGTMIPHRVDASPAGDDEETT